ncbi:MAG: bifunctional 5,10-methylenetetrahydrofolate dehydrogenase/5,10-methenyltetrahydrofolate cyclohydrolase [Firmicutes bacterium]|nr:bifunctional 5,10-methylenetetrahydrofolate dehydrogenase/5,10-methenyltetrahydrofolate cyclohydrolase [Bacillota bacterium]
MAQILKGAPVVESMNNKMTADVEALKARGIAPTLGILRVGERPEDLSYEKGATKKAEAVGVAVRHVVLPADVTQEDFDKTLQDLNADESVHGILMFRPLPEHLDSERARQMLSPAKDIDGCTDGSLAGVFTNSEIGFPPCTAEAALKVLEFYKVPLRGKRAAVVGRSLVVGRCAAMMLMHQDATVSICHTKTEDVAAVTSLCDVVVTSAGKLHYYDANYANDRQTIIDVGINWDDAKGKISGDVDFEHVEPIAHALTPVPGGVGAVTSCVLISHVVEAAKRAAQR